MTQVKKCRLLKLMVAAALIATPMLSFDDSAKAQDLLDEILNVDIMQIAESNADRNIPMIKDDLKVYLSDGEASITRGSHVEKVIKDQFVVLDGTEQVEGRDKLVPVSNEYNKDLYIRVINDNAGTIRLYSEPSSNTELNYTVQPDQKFVCQDMSTYNGNFIKVTDEANSVYYLDIHDIQYDVLTKEGKTFRVTSGNTRQVTNKTRNVTLDLQTPTNLTAAEIRPLIADSELEGIEDAVVEIEELYGINALFTISLAQIESGHGSSYLARTRNNLFGIAAYDGNEDAASSYSTKSDCVRQWGKLIKEWYFDEGRTTPYSIGEKYASNPNWGSDVESNMAYLARNL